MGEKFLGLGLMRVIGIWLMCCVLTVVAKTVLTKHHVPGVSEIIQAV